MPSQVQRCLIQELAGVMSREPALKKIRLDPERQKVSVAFFEGSENSSGLQEEIESIVSRYPPPDPGLGKENGQCPFCGHSHLRAFPRNIHLQNTSVEGCVLERDSCPIVPQTFHWRDVAWVRLRPRQFSFPFEIPLLTGWKKEMLAAVLCGLITAAAFLIERLMPVNTVALYLLAYLCGGFYVAQDVWALLRKKILDIHFLMISVAVGAAVIGHWWEGAVLLFLFSFSSALEEMTFARTEKEIRSLFKNAPKEALVLDERGRETKVSVEDLHPGMLMRVRPGEQFAADAEVIKGTTAANEANLTGESLPVDKAIGDTVLSGTLNLWGSVDCRILRAAEESTLAKIIRLIREAQESKAPSQRFTDKFGTGYTYLILGLSALMFFVWWLLFQIPPFVTVDGTSSAFYRTMTLLVVASPCALVLSIPSAILAGITAGAKNGVLFRGGAAIEQLSTVDHVALDKTGTLTTGELKVIKAESFPPGRENEVLTVAAAVAHYSSHPVSNAIIKAARERNIVFGEAKDFRSLTGMGLEAECLQGPFRGTVRLGRRELFFPSAWIDGLSFPDEAVTETLVECGELRGRILLSDEIRQVSAGLLQQLKNYGLKVTMLTGDREESARAVAEKLGLEDIRFRLSPEDKVRLIQEWRREGQNVAMVGDGVNDAPSLAAANVAVGMGLRGSDTVLEQADIVLMQDKIEKFLFAYRLSKRARTVIFQNLFISLGVIIVLVLSALGGLIPLTVGVIGHEGSTVVVVLNSLRLLFPAR